jgi:hypothetical protein
VLTVGALPVSTLLLAGHAGADDRCTDSTMAWRGLLAAFVVLGAPVMPASPASADSGLPAITHVYWTGAPCIDVVVAARFDPTQVEGRTVCEGTWRLSESNIWPGDAFGVDPIMGAADFIECAIFRGGERVWYDSAVAGDATDVTCLRRAV